MEKKHACKKVISLLSLYADNKVTYSEREFIEEHLAFCPECYKKYMYLKQLIYTLKDSYRKVVEMAAARNKNTTFSIREHEKFLENISPYIDDELCYDDSIKFRKYLLKSKPARAELASAYGLKNNIKHSVAMFKDKVNINYSKKVMKRLLDENKDSFENVYKRAAVVLGFMISTLILVSLYVGFNYVNKSFAEDIKQNIVKSVTFPKDDEYVEFYFDENNEALLTAK